MKRKHKPVTPITDKLGTIHATKGEGDELRALDSNCANLKMQIGDLELGYVARKSELVDQFVQAQKSYNTRCADIAKAHGIDPNDPSKGKWDFNGKSMTFTRVG